MEGMKRTIPVHEQKLQQAKKALKETQNLSKRRIQMDLRDKRQKWTLRFGKEPDKSKWREADAQYWYDASGATRPVKANKTVRGGVHGVRVHVCTHHEHKTTNVMVDDMGPQVARASVANSGSELRSTNSTAVGSESTGQKQRIWGRDTNASLNILEAGLSLWRDGRRPDYLQRTPPRS
jgi:hypothetical protein